MNNAKTVAILGIKVNALSLEETANLCERWLQATGTKLIFTPNPEILVYTLRHPAYKLVLQSADLLIPDGTGVWLAAIGRLPERVTGAELMFRLLNNAAKQETPVGFILRRDGLSTKQDIELALSRHFPKLRAAIAYSDEISGAAAAESRAEILLVGLGFPEQEQWCSQQRTHWPRVKIMLTVGGAIDYLTGEQSRAPSVLRAIGLEWLWRLFKQPWRWRRIITATIKFPWYVITHK